MKRFIGLLVASAAVALPATTAGALGNSAEPAEYRTECDTFYSNGQALFDPLIASPASAVLKPVESGACGENKHVA